MRNNRDVKDTGKQVANKLAARDLMAAAEQQLANTPKAKLPSQIGEDTLHRMQVQQIELELQNEELRRAQSIIEESRERYVDFYDFAPVGYITLGSDGKFEEINLTGATLIGEERNKLLHRSFVNFVAPEDLDRWRQYFSQVLQQDKKFTCEIVLLRNDGTRMHVQLDSLRLLKEGEVAVMRTALTDITERKQAEEAVRDQEEFFQMITENIEDFIAVLDLDGKLLYISPSYGRIFSNPENLQGKDGFAGVHPEDHDRVRQMFNETVQSGTGFKAEYRFVLADGSICHMESRGGLIRNSRSQASRVVVISRDITERIKVEEQIRNMAFYDTLTRLPNRRMLDDRMNHAMAASKRSGRYCALMFLDLDNFKPLNDLYGHSAGDMLLIEVAHRIDSCVREMDTVARFGGDEFVVMLSELDTAKESSIAQTRIVAEKIRNTLDRPYALNIKTGDAAAVKIEYHCTSSIGVVMFNDHEYSSSELLKLADREMYRAKENGRNQVCFFNE